MGSNLRFQHILTPDGLERHKRLEIDDQGVIVAVADETGPEFDGWLALPGMPDAHSHCFQRALVGMGEAAIGDDSFWSWRESMYSLAGTMTPEELADVAARAFADMLAGGFTSVAEFHYLHHLPDGTPGVDMARAVAEGARRAGIRLVLLPVLYQSGGFGQPPTARQTRFVHHDLEDYLMLVERLSDLSLGIAAHSLRAVSPESIAELEAGARSILGDTFPRHVHVSEQRREVSECLDRYGLTPIELLAEHVVLDPHWNLIHATHAMANEMDLMVRCGVTTVLCPLTEAYLGDGIFDARRLVSEGGRFAIGSDSNVRIDAVEELRMLEYSQRLRHEQRACLASEAGLGRSLWSAAATGGGAATGLPVGRLAPGAYADIVVLEQDNAERACLTVDGSLDALVTAGGAPDIAAVYVGGRQAVQSGRHGRDEEIDRAFAATLARLRNRL